MKKFVTSFFIVLAVGVLVLGFRVTARAGGEPEFWYPTDPELELLRIEFFGGMLGQQLRYSIYADDRLVIKRTGQEDLDILLSTEQARALVSAAVGGQLVEMTKARESELKNLASKYVNSDSGAVRLTLRLPHFKESADAEEREVNGQLTLMKMSTYANHFTDVPEVACIVEVTRVVRAYEKQYRERAAS